MLNMFDVSVAVKAQVKYLVDNLGMGVEFQEIRRGDRPLLSYVLSKLRTKRVEEFVEVEVVRELAVARLVQSAARMQVTRSAHGNTAIVETEAGSETRPATQAIETLILFDVAQAGSFAPQSAEIEQAGAADLGRAQQFDLVDHFGVNGEDALHALAEADLAHGEAGLRSVVALDDHAFEGLHAFLVAFLDLHVDANGVPGVKCGNVGALRFGQQLFDD